MGLGGQRSQLPALFCTPPPHPYSCGVTTRGQLCPCTPQAPSSENSQGQGQTGSCDLSVIAVITACRGTRCPFLHKIWAQPNGTTIPGH